MPRRNNREEAEQRLLAEILDMLGLFWFHPPNGGARTKAEAGIFKALGVKPGVPDIWILDRPPVDPVYVGLVIEMKAPKPYGRKPTESQEAWLSGLRARRFITATCYGFDEAVQVLKKLGYC